MKPQEQRPITSYQFFKTLTYLPYVDAIYLFGSHAKGLARTGSDIDLAIVCPRATKEEWDFIVLMVNNTDTLRKVDIVRFDTIKNQEFKDEIWETKVVLFERKS